MPKRILILNGPNLNLLGTRQPELYGHQTLSDIEKSCVDLAADLGVEIVFKQSNAEHEIVQWIQDERETSVGIIINPAAFSHTSIAILDALMMYDGPVVEVHLSNIHKREQFRHHSHVSARADAVIAGCGPDGYLFALKHIVELS